MPEKFFNELPPRTVPKKHTMANINPFVRPWFIKWAIDAVSPSSVATEIPIRIIPICEILEYANNFFMSCSKYAAKEPKKIVTRAKRKKMSSRKGLPINELKSPTSNKIRINRYKETFVAIAEKKHVAKAGAYLYEPGSHACNGKTADFISNPVIIKLIAVKWATACSESSNLVDISEKFNDPVSANKIPTPKTKKVAPIVPKIKYLKEANKFIDKPSIKDFFHILLDSIPWFLGRNINNIFRYVNPKFIDYLKDESWELKNKNNKIFCWTSDFEKTNGEGITANLFLRNLIDNGNFKKNEVLVKNLSNIVSYDKLEKINKSKRGGKLTIIEKYLDPFFGIFYLWYKYLTGNRVAFVNFLPLWNFILFLLLPPKTI